ncbi:guanine nucleotide binding protein, alpha subunit [Infundibulicybe gibba]|nr:guanine nucleotide binding protein, alpha subunit [Infundibulicybe gibba]
MKASATLALSSHHPTTFNPESIALETSTTPEEAERISKEIDEEIQEAKKVLERKRKAIQILLLGQSESGKSSVLKNFQLVFSPRNFQNERAAWKTIIHLNLIASIKKILSVLEEEWAPSGEHSTKPQNLPPLARELKLIKLGLSPLLSFESSLMKMISPDTRNAQCICGNEVAEAVKRRRSPSPANENDPSLVLAASKGDVVSLWENSAVQDVLEKRQIRLQDSPGFFLDDIDRIASHDYDPTDLDIIKARLRTVGVEEHHLVIEKGIDAGSEVYIIDVGGARSAVRTTGYHLPESISNVLQRASWVPYFDEVNAILFLAPLAFNQCLERTQRSTGWLEDSLSLWREICSNKLLAAANIILFLNKKDVLTATLAAGTSVKKYVPSYGDGPNDVAHVTKYFRDKFRGYHRRFSPIARPFICYETSAVDTSSMAAILMGVREIILRRHLREGEIL